MVNSLNNKRKVTGKKHEHTYQARGGCKEVFEARDEEVLISGSAGTGKSRACLEKVHAMCLLTSNTRGLILRKTLSSLGSTALVTWRNFVIKEALLTGDVVYYGGSSQEAAQYRYRNGSTVTIGGLDKPTRIMSGEYDIVYIQEATEVTIEDIEYVKTRLRNWKTSFQQLIMDCNPNSDKHPLKLRCNDGLCRLIESRHEDNPRLFDLIPDGTYQVTDRGAKYMSILDNLTGVRYKRLRLGLWVSAEGVIYEEFDPTIHVLNWEYDDEGNKLPFPQEWPRYWVIDFGYVNPFVLKCYARGDDGEIYMYREIYMSGRTVQEHAQTILDCVTKQEAFTWYDHFEKCERTQYKTVWTEPKPVRIICDHDAEDRRTFEKATGLSTIPARKAVNTGIDLHKNRLKVNRDGFTRFYLMDDSLVQRDERLAQLLLPTCSAEEYPSYQWKKGQDGRTKDEPIKEDDHGCDCDRYLTMELDFRGQARATLVSMDMEDL
jgi:PBSX family phage terminase large subunit